MGVFSLTLIHKCRNTGRAFTRRPPCYAIKAYSSFHWCPFRAFGFTRYSTFTPYVLRTPCTVPRPFPCNTIPHVRLSRDASRVSRTRLCPFPFAIPHALPALNLGLRALNHLSRSRAGLHFHPRPSPDTHVPLRHCVRHFSLTPYSLIPCTLPVTSRCPLAHVLASG